MASNTFIHIIVSQVSLNSETLFMFSSLFLRFVEPVERNWLSYFKNTYCRRHCMVQINSLKSKNKIHVLLFQCCHNSEHLTNKKQQSVKQYPKYGAVSMVNLKMRGSLMSLVF